MFKQLLTWFWRPSTTHRLGVIFLCGTGFGILFWGGFNAAMEATNTLEFCISCHEMEQAVYQEYKKSAHFRNRTGIQVICSDCHVPKAWLPKLIRKIRAAGEIYHKVMGNIDTLEKFESKRLELAQRVWDTMEANDSLECRNCHDFQNMDLAKQERRPQEKHPEAMEAGESCIDCHKGIVHALPEDYDEDD